MKKLYLCDKCKKKGHLDEGAQCPSCGGPLREPTPSPAPRVDASALRSELYGAKGSRVLRPQFIGSAGEYFRIWIVNTFLTIITLGIYAAWATVRTRRYFYRNTVLDGHPFDYPAEPRRILIGYMIIGSMFLLYKVYEVMNPLVSLSVVMAFYLILPFLIFKSLRFFAHNSAYRNIRFRFRGTLGESYLLYLLYGFLIIITLGWIVPYWEYRKKKYFFNNMAFGSAVNQFTGSAGGFYKVYITVSLFVFMFMMLAFVFIGGIGAALFSDKTLPLNNALPGGGMLALIAVTYIIMLATMVYAQQYIYTWQTNYCFNESTLGGVRFRSTLEASSLFWIRFSNILAIIFSAGLLIPWAKVRRTRYVLDNIEVLDNGSLDSFTTAASGDEAAYGDVATDFFDFEVGL